MLRFGLHVLVGPLLGIPIYLGGTAIVWALQGQDDLEFILLFAVPPMVMFLFPIAWLAAMPTAVANIMMARRLQRAVHRQVASGASGAIASMLLLSWVPLSVLEQGPTGIPLLALAGGMSALLCNWLFENYHPNIDERSRRPR